MDRKPDFAIGEAAARELLLLRAFEAQDDPTWTAADRDWATRVARASLGDDNRPGRLLLERTRHAMQRLAPREAGVRAALNARVSLRPWAALAVLLGLIVGVVVDHIGPAQRINLLAPPIWVLVVWNLLVILLIVLRPLLPARPPGRLRRWLAAAWQPPTGRTGRGEALQRFRTDWLRVSAPLNGARAAFVLHLGAAALALGLLGGMYLRGLVLDYRAGWQSTFLGAESVHALLAPALAPASALTGIPVPDAAALAAMQVGPEQPAQAPAAPWLHLYAATLGLFVIGPRLVLAALARARVWRLQRRLPLPLQEPWFQQWLRPAGGLAGTVWLLPHAAPVAAATALALQSALDGLSQGRARLQAAPPVPYGDEDRPDATTPPPDAAAVLLLLDMASTPEAEVHGRLLDRLAAAAPGAHRVLLVDEAGFRQRLAATDRRLDERRQAWQQLADAHGTPLLAADLGAEPQELQTALARCLT
ncbi:MAG: DUF2868 domain-containing protein [Rubrivivax sp.]